MHHKVPQQIKIMEYRQLGNSGLRVSALSFGTGTFGGGDDEAFRSIGANDLAEATRVVDVCLEGGINLFDTADAYSAGQSEDILGKTLKGRRDQVLIATKAFFRMGPRGKRYRRFAPALDCRLRSEFAPPGNGLYRPLPGPLFRRINAARRNIGRA